MLARFGAMLAVLACCGDDAPPTAVPGRSPPSPARTLEAARAFSQWYSDPRAHPPGVELADELTFQPADSETNARGHGKRAYVEAVRAGPPLKPCMSKLLLAGAGRSVELRFCSRGIKGHPYRELVALDLLLGRDAKIVQILKWNDVLSMYSQAGAPLEVPFYAEDDPAPSAPAVVVASAGSDREAAHERQMRAVFDALNSKDRVAFAAAIGADGIVLRRVNIEPPRTLSRDELATWLTRQDADGARYTIGEVWCGGDWAVLRVTHSYRLHEAVR